MTRGAVLVVGATDREYVPAMKLASAIVAEEEGSRPTPPSFPWSSAYPAW